MDLVGLATSSDHAGNPTIINRVLCDLAQSSLNGMATATYMLVLVAISKLPIFPQLLLETRHVMIDSSDQQLGK